MVKLTKKQNTKNLSGGTATLPSISFGDGDTGFYESADDVLGVTIGGTVQAVFSGSSFFGGASGSYDLVNVAATTNQPTLIPNKSDTNTGVGWAAADQLSLIAGGVEGVRITESGNVISDVSINGPVTNQTGINAVCNDNQVVCNNNEIVFS